MTLIYEDEYTRYLLMRILLSASGYAYNNLFMKIMSSYEHPEDFLELCLLQNSIKTEAELRLMTLRLLLVCCHTNSL
ncbi:hypothetical protein Patl1_02043 [Pistacia atlantica]|uniref:Uncharacterized protein n=1 Tax=Pistacia atlantica TaxID=434234 RepID=A0ACC1C5P0_9ROSI|nr:hypothetical protein Patl1_02043 [Pistacia atlantica]